MSTPRWTPKPHVEIPRDSMPGMHTEQEFRDYLNTTLRGLFEGRKDSPATREQIKAVVQKAVHERLPAGVDRSKIEVVDMGDGRIDVKFELRGPEPIGFEFNDIKMDTAPPAPNTFMSDLKEL